jgi:hypothetical protein
VPLYRLVERGQALEIWVVNELPVALHGGKVRWSVRAGDRQLEGEAAATVAAGDTVEARCGAGRAVETCAAGAGAATGTTVAAHTGGPCSQARATEATGTAHTTGAAVAARGTVEAQCRAGRAVKPCATVTGAATGTTLTADTGEPGPRTRAAGTTVAADTTGATVAAGDTVEAQCRAGRAVKSRATVTGAAARTASAARTLSAGRGTHTAGATDAPGTAIPAVTAHDASETQRGPGGTVKTRATISSATPGTTGGAHLRGACRTGHPAKTGGPRRAADTTGATGTAGTTIGAIRTHECPGETVDAGTAGTADTARTATARVTPDARDEASGAAVAAITAVTPGATVTAGVTRVDPVSPGATINAPTADTAIAAIAHRRQPADAAAVTTATRGYTGRRRSTRAT